MGSIFGLRSNSKLQEFEQYLLKEYENIAEAHFKTIEAISSFFRYYLIIMALPFTLYSAIIGLSPQMGQFIYALAFLAALVSLIIALVGFFVLLYVVNLRMDVILYARTVNAIRKHFYDNADLDINSKLRLRTLPQTPSLPGYFEPSYFLPVTISFAIFNMVYLSMGLILFFTPLPEISNLISLSSILGLIKDVPLWIWIATPLFFVSHLMGYYLIARHRELSYLKSYAIGVDIDGVLNEHRPHFCDLLSTLVHKQLDPDSITKIPVHEEPSLGISRDDEKRVFNDPRYWTEMPCAKSSALSIRKLRNALKLKVHIFTYRPWPSEEIRQKVDSRKEWENAAILVCRKSNFVLPRLLRQLRSQHRLYGCVEKVIDQFLTLRMRTENVWGL